MHFLAQTTLNGDDVAYIITANSWSNCLSYLEGTGRDFDQIIKLGDTTSVVLNTPSTTNCYSVSLKDVNTQQRFNYVVFDNSFTCNFLCTPHKSGILIQKGCPICILSVGWVLVAHKSSGSYHIRLRSQYP